MTHQSKTAMKALLACLFVLGLLCAHPAAAQGRLRLITWSDYAPADVIAQFKKETGIQVDVTLSNNEEIISKLRATGGAGFDLAQPSQDRITGVQREFGVYKPIDLSKVSPASRRPWMARSTACRTCGVPRGWSPTSSTPRSRTTWTCARQL
jgi:spermidine/putrescine transport system substrate-binding protein